MCFFWLCRNVGESRQKRRCKYNMFLLWGICHLVVQRKIIRKVNDNDDGRVVMRGALYLTGEASYALTHPVRFCGRSGGRSLGRWAVLNG